MKHKYNSFEYRLLLLLFSYFLFNSNVAYAQQLIHKINLDFEISEPGKLGYGWRMPEKFEKIGYKAYSNQVNPISGKFSLQLESIYKSIIDAEIKDSSKYIAVCYQEIDANNYIGTEISFSVTSILENTSEFNYAIFYLEQSNNDTSFVVFSDTLRHNDIQTNILKSKVHQDMSTIRYGFVINGFVKAKIDDVELNMNFDKSKNIKSIVVTENQSSNLISLAKSIGNVRYFAPIPVYSKVNWDNLTYNYVKDIFEKGDEFDILEKIKLDFATFLNVSNSNKVVSDSVYCYEYSGLPSSKESQIIFGKIVNIYEPTTEYPGIVLQVINIEKIQSESLSFSAKAKLKKYTFNGKFNIWVRIDSKEGQSLIEYKSPELSTNSIDWETIKFTINTPKDAANVRLGLVLSGDGEVLVDDVEMAINYKGKTQTTNLRNNNFDEKNNSKSIIGWSMPQYSMIYGYSNSLVSKGINNSNCLQIKSNKQNAVVFPERYNKYTETFPNKKSIDFPQSLNIKQIDFVEKPKINFPDNFAINEEDVYSRFVILIDLYNYIRNFSYNKVIDEKINEAFIQAIKAASKEISTNSFLDIIHNFYAITGDLNAKFWNSNSDNSYLPKIGLQIDGENNIPLVYSASSLGIPDSSIILKVEDTEISKMMILDNNPKFEIYKNIVRLLSGRQKTIVNLTYKTPNGEIKVATLERSSYQLKNLSLPDFATELDTGIIYINSSMINDIELKSILPQLLAPDIKGIIFDFRGISKISDYFLGVLTDKTNLNYTTEIPIYTAPNKSLVSYYSFESEIRNFPKLNNTKLVFLVNHATRSNSNLISYIAKENKIATIIGERTQNNYVDVGEVFLPAFFYGTQSYFRVKYNGKYLEQPVVPDIEVIQTFEATAQDIDLQLDKAIEILKN